MPTGPAFKIADLIVRIPPREFTGAETDEKYGFQLHWAVTELLERQRAGQNYCVLLEYHDDVVLLDDATDPTHADFYQVKAKRSGYWRTTDLVKPGGKKKTELSTIGKLYTHRLNFPNASIGLHFVSNVPLAEPLDDGRNPDDVRVVRCTELTERNRTKLITAIRRDHDIPDDGEVDLPDITAFLFCTFSPAGARDHVLGQLEGFLEEVFPDRQIGASPVYKTLITELRRQNQCRQRADSLSALIRLHGFTRSQFEELLRVAGVRDNTAAEWHSIETGMAEAAWPVAERLRVKSAWRRYVVQRGDYGDHQLRRVRSDLRARAAAAMRRDDLDLRGLVAFMLSAIPGTSTLRSLYDSDFLTAAALAELVISPDEPLEFSSAGEPPPDDRRSFPARATDTLGPRSDAALPADGDLE